MLAHACNSTGGVERSQPIAPLVLPPLEPLVDPELLDPVDPDVLAPELELEPPPGAQTPSSGSAGMGMAQCRPAPQVGAPDGLQSVAHRPAAPCGRQTIPVLHADEMSARVADGSHVVPVPPPWKQRPVVTPPITSGTQDPAPGGSPSTSQVASSAPLPVPQSSSAQPPEWQKVSRSGQSPSVWHGCSHSLPPPGSAKQPSGQAQSAPFEHGANWPPPPGPHPLLLPLVEPPLAPPVVLPPVDPLVLPPVDPLVLPLLLPPVVPLAPLVLPPLEHPAPSYRQLPAAQPRNVWPQGAGQQSAPVVQVVKPHPLLPELLLEPPQSGGSSCLHRPLFPSHHQPPQHQEPSPHFTPPPSGPGTESGEDWTQAPPLELPVEPLVLLPVVEPEELDDPEIPDVLPLLPLAPVVPPLLLVARHPPPGVLLGISPAGQGGRQQTVSARSAKQDSSCAGVAAGPTQAGPWRHWPPAASQPPQPAQLPLVDDPAGPPFSSIA